MSGNWLSGKPTRHLDGAQTAERALLAAQMSENERRAKHAYWRCVNRYGKDTVTHIMQAGDSPTAFPEWPALADAFERLAAYTADDRRSLDDVFYGVIDLEAVHAFQDAEAEAAANERAEMRSDLYQF